MYVVIKTFHTLHDYLLLLFYSLLFGLMTTGFVNLYEMFETGYWEGNPNKKYVRFIIVMSLLGLSIQLKEGPKPMFWPPPFKRGSRAILVTVFQCLLFGVATVGVGVVLTRIFFPEVRWDSNAFLLLPVLAASVWYYFQAPKSAR